MQLWTQKPLNKGFTLIELLVAMSITLLLAGGVVAAFNTFNDNQRVQQGAVTLKSNLRFAQNKAISGDKPDGCGILDGYTVTFASNIYSMQAVCDGVATGTAVTFSLPTGIAFTPVPTAITFAVLSGRVGGDRTITISGLYKSFAVTVSADGSVSTTY